MADAAIAELNLAEECYALAAEQSFSKRELSSLKRLMAKRSEGELFAALCSLGAASSSTDISQAIGTLYSLTEQQLTGLEAALKTIQGWD